MVTRLRQTHTFVTLEISNAAYNEIKEKLKAAGYDHAFIDVDDFTAAIDMHGIGLVCEAEPYTPVEGN